MANFKNSKDSVILYEKTEASRWEESFLLGNGTLGASVFSGISYDRVALNHDTLWSGYPRNGEYRNDSKTALEKAKALLREKKYVEADKEISDNFSQYPSASFMPFGELTVNYRHDSSIPVKEYKRILDLTTALNTVSYKIGDAVYKRHSYVSFPDNVIVYRAECKNGQFSPAVSFNSQLYSRVHILDRRLVLEVECPVTDQQALDRTDRKRLYFDEPEKRGIRAMGIASVKADGKMLYCGNQIFIDNATYLEVRITIETSYNGYKKHPFLEGKPYAQNCLNSIKRVEALSEPEMLKRHIADHKRFFNRMCLNLGSSNKSRVVTSKRMVDYQNGGEDKALPALLFNFGRYLTIASSRKGSQATNLQGIWNPAFYAPWHSNYTININTEMNYFPTLMIGLPEMYEPMIRLISEVSESGKRTARDLYGADGWVSHHNTDLWRHTQPVAGLALFLYWNASPAWLCHHLYEYYQFTLDKVYLEKKAFPIMCEAARFYLSQLETAQDGTRVVFASTSPENRFKIDGGLAAVSETTEMTMACVRELFGNIIDACSVLNTENEVTAEVKKEFPALRPSKVGSDGRLLEWYGEHEETDVHHRHVSHLYGLHPSSEISPLKTPELAQACRKTLDTRGDEGTGWSLAWKCNFFARLFDGDHAFKLVKRQLNVSNAKGIVMSGGGTYTNLMCAHPPFQIDGNFGVVSGMCEMLVQSEPDIVHVIPALPSEWTDISVRGIRAKGRRKVDLIIKNGVLVYCKISGSAPKKIYIAGKDCTDKFIFDGKASILK